MDASTHDAQLETFLDRVCASLKDDEELYLEVREEVRSHIEESEDPTEAMYAFGAAEEVGERLLVANAARMKRRALTKTILRKVVLPAGIVAALAITVSSSVRIWSLGSPSEDLFPKLPGSWKQTSSSDALQLVAKSERDHPFLELTTTHEHLASTRRDYWLANRSDPVAYAGWVNILQDCGGKLPADIDEHEAIEPDNALYLYCKAIDLLQSSSDTEYLKDGEVPPEYRGCHVLSIGLIIEDAEDFDAGIEAFLAATKKPVFRRYSEEYYLRRTSLFRAEDNSVKDRLDRIADANLWQGDGAGMLENWMSQIILPRTADLFEAGADAEALALMRGYLAMARHMAMDVGDSVVRWDAQGTMTRNIGQSFPPLLRSNGYPELAEEIETRFRPYLDSHPWKPNTWSANAEQIERYGGLLLWGLEGLNDGERYVPMLAPGVEEVAFYTQEDLKPGRLLDYNLAEQVIARLFVLITLLLMAFTAYRLWRVRRRGERSPFVVPNWRALSAVILFGVFLPALAYWGWTRLSPYSGRDLSIRADVWGHGALMFGAAVALLVLPLGMIYRIVRRRSRNLGIRGRTELAFNRLAISVTAALALLVGCIAIPLLRLEERNLVRADFTLAVPKETGQINYLTAKYQAILPYWRNFSSEALDLPDELWELAEN